MSLLNRSTEDLLRKASKERGDAMVSHDVLKLVRCSPYPRHGRAMLYPL